jgi:hypothetical protein
MISREPSDERDLLALVLARVEERLPGDWKVISIIQPTPRGPDALLQIEAPDGSSARVLVEAKTTVDPRNALYALDQLRSYRTMMDAQPEPALLVISRYLSPRTRDVLTEGGASYADATGNLQLRLDRPAVFIASEGAETNPWGDPRVRETKTLRGVPAARVVRALCDWAPPTKALELAGRADTSVGATYRVLDLLDREALIRRRGKGLVLEVNWPSLLRRWSADYDFADRNRTATFVAGRGFSDLFTRLASEYQARYAVTGSFAASRVARYAEPRLATIYVDDREAAAEQLGLRPATKGANVVLAEPFNDVVYQRAILERGVAYVAPSQAAVDLMTGPGRSPGEGEELLRWMEENESAWRL